MTVMFCDVVDSTALAESLDPEDFREVLTGYQAACARAIERFNGYAAQWIGDGVLAYFGYPRAHEDDAQRAVHASLGILEEVVALNDRLIELFDVSVQVRVGLHSGVVIAGEMGAGATREPLAIAGETPHIASRLQTLAPPGSVVLTDATRDLTADRFETQALGMRSLKGISRPIAIHRLVGLTGETPHRRASGPLDETPLVDRAGERARLMEAWQRAASGQGLIVHVIGEAGIGKSRLVREMREQVTGQAAAQHILQCSPHHSSTALYPAIRLLERLTALDRTQTPQSQLEAIERFVAETGLDRPDSVALIADLLSVPGGAEATRSLMPRDARNATLQILEALLVGGAARHPLLFVAEDLHWADPTTVELLERIVASVESIPTLCVLTFRDDFEPPWTEWQPVLEVDLGPLASQDVRAMVAAASPTALGEDALVRVEAAADGVPLFVEEMVKVLAAGGEANTPAQRAVLVVPPTLQGLLAERLDRLPELAGVIDVAAVLGREFERGLLQALSPRDERDFQSAVAQLAAEDVLRPVEGSRSRLEFKHALLQEAAYDRLLRRRRSVLHGRVAELLVARSPSAWESEPERVAHHWSSAGHPAKALAYWQLAGQKALKRAAFLEAAEHFRRGVEALDAARPAPDGDLERGDMLTHLGAALQAGRTPAANVDVIYARARDACLRAGRRERLVPVIRGQYLFHLARAEFPQALELADEMLAMGQHGARSPWLAEGHFYLGFASMLTGHLDRARTEFEDAIRHYDPTDRGSDQIYDAQSDPGVGALAYLAGLLWNQGFAREALEKSDESLALADRVGGPVTLAQAWGMRCGLLIVQGRWAEFAQWLEKARTHSVERNIGYWSTVCSLWSAWIQGRSGEPETGRALLQKHLDAYLSSGGRVGLPHFQALLAELHLAAGERRRALEALRAGQEHIDAAGERFYEPELQWLMARVLMTGDAPDADAATATYQRAVDAANGQHARLLELRAATGLLLHQRRIGDAPTAAARVASLSSWFGPDSNVADVLRARTLLAEQPTHR
ncbi:MAG TPA: adenylate/guanylate cyclase domain-containing protein [Solirubrobacteraceae bacterium]|nr:adenylate/guanylate cyclase domain-containing protein [Solirubrobacteraceae bacterium]